MLLSVAGAFYSQRIFSVANSAADSKFDFLHFLRCSFTPPAAFIFANWKKSQFFGKFFHFWISPVIETVIDTHPYRVLSRPTNTDFATHSQSDDKWDFCMSCREVSP